MSFVNIYPLGWLAVAGVAGVLSRWGLSSLWAERSALFPWNTFWINLLGSFLAGALWGGMSRGLISVDLARILAIGFLGGFTTFSAFSVELLQMAQSGRWSLLVLYLILSPALGLACALLGHRLIEMI